MPIKPLPRSRRAVNAIATLITLALCACQPTPEERYAKAEAYFAEGEYRSGVIELKNVLQEDPESLPARRLLADASYALADFAAAEAGYRRLLEAGVSDAELWIAYGRTLLAQGKAREVLESVGPNLDEYGDSEDSLLLSGDVYSALGSIDAAEERYRLALAQNSDSPEALIGLARVAAARNELTTAEQFLDRAVALDPESPTGHRARADYRLTRLDFAGAIGAYDKAIAVEIPTTPVAERYAARRGLTASLIASGDFERATAVLERGLRQIAPRDPGISFFRGQIAFAQNDYELARQEMLTYLAVVPDDPRAQAILGAINFSNNNLLQAEQYLSTAVRANVGGDRARMLLAETQIRLDKPDAAVDNLEQAAGQSDAVVLAMLGRAKLHEGDTETAIDYFERSAAIEDGNQSINLALAASYMRAGRFGEAIDILTPMPIGTDGNFRREVLLITAHIQQGHSAQAAAVGEAVLQASADDATAQALVGVLHQSLGDMKRARRHFDRALELDPTNIGALYSLGTTAFANGRVTQGIDHLERLLDAHPAFLPALTQLAVMLERAGELDSINSRLQAARKAAPDAAPLRKLSARLLLVQGQTEAALEEIERGREQSPNDAEFLFLKGTAETQRGNIKSALTYLSRAARAEPQNATYQFELARSRLANRDFAQALFAARAYRELRPADVRGLAIEVDAELRAGDPNRARRAVEDYVAAYPRDSFISMLYGDIELATGNAEAALKHYEEYAQSDWNRVVVLRLTAAHKAAGTGRTMESVERWVAEQPDDAAMRRLYAQLLEESGDVDRAIAEYERLEKDGSIDAAALNNLAWHYMVSGRDGAVELAERAHEMEPGNGSISDTLGWILYQEGEIERAVELLRHAVEQSPGNPEIRYHLAAALSESGRGAEARSIVDELLESGIDFPSRSEVEQLARTL